LHLVLLPRPEIAIASPVSAFLRAAVAVAGGVFDIARTVRARALQQGLRVSFRGPERLYTVALDVL